MLPITALKPVLQPCRLYCFVEAIMFKLNRIFQGNVCCAPTMIFPCQPLLVKSSGLLFKSMYDKPPFI